MTDVGAHALIPRDGSVVMFMLVRRPDGTPTGYPMTGIFRRGELQITTYRKAAKARFLLADGRVCCVVPDADVPGRGIALYGRARETTADALVQSTRGAPAGAMDVPAEVRATVRDRLERDKRMVFRIDVERTVAIGPGRS